MVARVIVGYCARNGISPNAVTLTGLVLVIAACVLFWNGWYLSGLACGWVMTLLDTVDGKLARVTVQSSRVGHVLDHGMDIIHPPFWYVFWGLSLDAGTAFFGVSVQAACWWVVAGYVGGRIVEGLSRPGFEIAFPRRFELILKTIGLLPNRAYLWSVRKLLGMG